MKRTPIRLLPFSSLLFAITAFAVDAKPVDYEAFLSQYDLTWDSAAKDHGSSAFIGNGLMGSTIWSRGDEVLHWHLGRNDVYDTAPGTKHRMPIGKLVLHLKGKPSKQAMRQSLYRAEVSGNITTDRGGMTWRSMFPHEEQVGLIAYTLRGDEQAEFRFAGLPAVNANLLRNTLREVMTDANNPELAKVRDFFEPAYAPVVERLVKEDAAFQFPAAVHQRSGDVECVTQGFSNGGGYVVAWAVREVSEGRFLCAYTIDFAPEGTVSHEGAVAKIRQALVTGYDALSQPHYAWWQQYYSRSFLSVPDAEIERFYWLQLYKMASATRVDGPILDQIGPWMRATAWARTWCNINVQIAYHSMLTSNRLDLFQPFLDLFNSNYDNLQAAVPQPYQEPGTLALGRTMDLYGSTGCSREFGNLSWALHDYWMYCRYTGDEQLLIDKLYPLLKGSGRLMMKVLEQDTEGVYHVIPDISPEYPRDPMPDTNYNLGLLVWNLRVLQYLNDTYDLKDSDAPKWKDTLEHLVPYPVDKNGLMLGTDAPFTQSHRHYSHLLPCYPLRVVDVESPDGLALFRKSYNHWRGLAGPSNRSWNTFSMFGAAGMAAWMRDGNETRDRLLDGIRATSSSTFFKGPGPAIESVICGNVAITEMLLQSATTDPGEYRMRVFPAIPSDWKDVRFDNLLAEGGFEVSAALQDGRLQFVKIHSKVGKPCRVEAPFAGEVTATGPRAFTVTPATDDHGHRVYEIDLKAGETALLVVSQR